MIDAKSNIALKLSLAASPIFALVEKYLWSDWEFIKFLAVIVLIDTVTGIIKHYRLKSISSNGFGRFFVKVIVYFLFLVVVHNLTHYTTDGELDGLFGWLDSLAYAAVMCREAISIFENLGVIYPGIIPQWIMQRLKAFDKTGKLESDE